MQPCGNQGVIEHLLNCAQKARDNPNIRLAAVALIERDDDLPSQIAGTACDTVSMDCSYAGDPLLERFGWNCGPQINEMFRQSLGNYLPPPRDENLGYDYWSYNVACGAQSFDFVHCLLNAEMDRIQMGFPAPLKVGFWMGYYPLAGMHIERRQHWLNHVFRPCLKLIGAVENQRALYGCHFEVMWSSYRRVVERSRAGEAVPKLKAPLELVTQANGLAGCVTITLRETDYWIERNSNVPEWLRFAEWLKQHGERVIFVRDTAYADKPIPGFPVCADAARSVVHRAALYEVAKANLFVSNGPCMIAMFGNKPCMVMVEVRDDKYFPYWPNTPTAWAHNIGVQVGEQFPWCRSDQRIIWERDNFDNLMQGWQQLWHTV